MRARAALLTFRAEGRAHYSTAVNPSKSPASVTAQQAPQLVKEGRSMCKCLVCP